MANIEKRFLGTAGVERLVENIRTEINEGDAKVLNDAKLYADGLADNYDAAGTAVSKVQELADGKVKENTDAIAKLNGDATTEGSVAKAVADSESKLSNMIAEVAEKVDAAQADADALEVDIGSVDSLSTANKTVVGAINEVLAAVGTGGTAAVVTVTTDTTTEGALKSYTIKQGETTVGVIDIPKDMVVEDAHVIVLEDGDVDGYEAGTYIEMSIANVAEPLYINVGTLVDIYKPAANATQVQIAIDQSTREISAVIVAGSITSAELADNSVITAKIADGNVTKEKLSSAVQASLDKADASATQASLDEEVDRAKAAEAQALTDAKAYTSEQVAAELERAEGVEAGLNDRLTAIEGDYLKNADKTELAGAIEEEVTRAKAAEEANTAAIEGLSDAKADRATTLAGYDIEDAYTKEEVDSLFYEKVAQADWDVSDESDPAYIKNRTHYLEPVVSTEYSASFTGTGHSETMSSSQPGAPSYYLPEKVGQEFIVIYDGVEYACTLQSVQSGYTKIGLGDSSLVSYPFYITFEYSNVIGISIDVSTAGDHTIKVGQRYYSVKQLDEKFIPDTIARVSNLENVAEELSTEINTAIENLDVDTIARKDEVAQADWAENDENSPAYVKNRTHYTEAIKIIDGITVNCDESYDRGYKPSATIPNLLAPPENGKTYIVIFDDIEYRLVAREAWGHIYVGNCNLDSAQAPDTGEPFCVEVTKSSLSPYIYAKEQGIHTISIISQDDLKYNQLDERFIPDTIARVSVVNTTINEGDSATLEASKTYAEEQAGTAEQNAKNYVDTEIAKTDAEVAGLRSDVDELMATSYVEITTDEIDAMFATA